MTDDTQRAQSNNVYTKLLEAIGDRAPDAKPETQQTPTTAAVAPDETTVIHDGREPITPSMAWSDAEDSTLWPTVENEVERRGWRLPVALTMAAGLAVAGGLGVYFLKAEHRTATTQAAVARQDAPRPVAQPPAPTPLAVIPSAPPAAPAPPVVHVDPNWPTGWQNAAKAFEQVPPPAGECYADDGAPFTWENFIGPAVNCTPPRGAITGGFLPLPPRMRGVLPSDPGIRRQFGDVPTQNPQPHPDQECTERSCPGGNF